MNKKEILKVVLGIIIGAAIFSISTGILWFLLNYFLAKSNLGCGGMMGCLDFGRTSGSLATGVLGFLLGILSGGVVGLLVFGSRADRIFSFILGLIINGFMPILIILFLNGHIDFADLSKLAFFSFLANCLLGGFLGVLMNSIFRLRMFNKSELQ